MTNTVAGYKPFDFNTEFLSAEERDTYMRVMRHVAETARESGCRDLLVNDLEILTSLEEKNEAMFMEWLNR